MSDASTGSNVYLAIGYADGKPVMKVGKANDVRRRKYQIKLDIDLYVECKDEMAAFALETKIRQAMRSFGAKQHKGKDWFDLDVDVFNVVKSFLTDELGITMLKGFNRKFVSAEDYEIAWYRACYADMKRWDVEKCEFQKQFDALTNNIKKLSEDIDRLEREREFIEYLRTASIDELKKLEGHEFYESNRTEIRMLIVYRTDLVQERLAEASRLLELYRSGAITPSL